MTTDIATLGIAVDTTQVVEGSRALDALGTSSQGVEQKLGALNGQMNDTAKIMRTQAEAASAASEASQRFLGKLQQEIDLYGLNRGEMERYKAAMLGLSSTTQQTAAAMGMKIDAMHRDERAAKDAAAAEDQATKAGDRFIKGLQDQVATLGMTTAQLREYRAAQLGVSDAAAPLISKLNETGTGAHTAGKHMETLNFQTVGARRELLVLAHELSQGNYQKFGGSMMVLGEQTGAAGLLFSAAGLSILAVVAALGVMSFAAIKGAMDQKHMNDALIMTGNYAGLTSDSLNALAHAAVEAGGSIGEAKKVATELAGSGKFTGEQIGYITEATVAWEHATGQSIKSIIKDFESLAVQSQGSTMRATEMISRATIKLDDTYHFLTESVYEQIRALEKEGDAKGASALATAEFARVTKDRAEEIIHNLGGIARGWNGIKESIGGAMDKMGEWGKKQTPMTDIAKYSAQLAKFDSTIAFGNKWSGSAPGTMDDQTSKDRLEIVRNLKNAQDALNTANKVAEAQAETARTQSAGAHAAANIAMSDAKLQKKGMNELQIELAAYAENVAKVKAANPASPLVTDEAVAAGIAARTKAHTAEVKGNDDRAALLQGALAREQSALESEKSIYDSRTKMLEKYHNGLGLSDAEFYAGRANARAEYVASEAISFAKESAIIQGYRPKNAEEIASNKNKYDELVKQHKKFTEDMRNAGGEDSAGAAATVQKQFDDYAKAVNTAGDAEIKTLDAAIAKQREHNAEIGKSKEQVELARQAKESAATETMQIESDAIQAVLDEQDANKVLADKYRDIYAARMAYLDREIAKRRELGVLLGAGADLEAGTKAAQELDKYLNPAKGRAFGDSLRDGFDGAGNAISKMIQQLEKYGVKDAQIEAQRKNAKTAYEKGQITEQKYIASTEELDRRSAINKVGGYAAMSDAAQGYFKEGSRGYEAIGAASKILHAAEMAMNIASIAPAMAAGAAQFFAQSGWGGFAGVAAMAAVVAAFGVAVTGGGSSAGGQTAADVQKAQGTGTVFGNSDAKSASIARGIELSAANSNIQLNYTAGMLAALKSIDASMSGLANLVAGTTGLTDGSNMGIKEGAIPLDGVMGSISSAIKQRTWLGQIAGGLVDALFGKVSQNIVDSGLQLGGSVNDLQSGKGFQQYASVDTTKSSWFGLSKNTSNSVKTAGLDGDLSSQFGLIFTNLESALKVAAGGLGIGADAVGSALDHLVISTTKISLKDLKGDELTAAINGVISATMDTMAEAAIPGLAQFRKVGEGYAETVIRISTDYANVDGILMGIGKTFGAVGLGSVAARENLIALAGGIDELASQTNGFATNFLSKAEQLAPVAKYVTEQLAAMGLAGVQTRDDFKNVVMGLNLADPAAQQTYASLMALSDAFAKTHAATVDLSKTEQEIADERKDLQSQLDELTMSSAQLLKKQRDALDGSNQALFDQIQVATKAKAAQDAAKASLTTFLGTMTTFANSVKGWNSTLVMGSLSTLTPEQQYAEARRQFETTRDKAATGDSAAQGQLQAMENAFLTISQKINGSDSQYSSDLAGVMKANDQLAAWSAGQVDVAQASLDALNDQVDGIAQLNATMLTVAQNMQYLPTLTGNVSTPVFATPTPAIDYSTYGTASVAPLVAAITALQAEVKALRADNDRQTGDLMQNAEAVGAKTAETIVDGVEEAVTDGAYAASNDTRRPT